MIDKNKLNDLVKWLKKEVLNAKAKGVVFGLSGGIDSAVTAGISKLAFPETSLGIIMPIHSISEDEEDARLIAEKLSLKVEKVDLTSTFDELIKASFDGKHKLAKSNIKPRLRMTTLYYYAQELGYLVLGSSNKSEYHIGYFTKHGDNGSDLMPLVDFTKEEIYQLAELLEIPKKIIDKKPSAGLWKGQTDEDEMGFSYDILDAKIRGEKVPEEIGKLIDKKYKASEHKRRLPLNYNNK